MTKDQFYKRLERLKARNERIRQRRELHEEAHRLDRKRETSKLLALYLFGLLNGIVIFAMVAMWHFGDLSYLGVLITDIAAQILVYGIYCLKAYKGKKSEEDMRFERDKFDAEMMDLLHAGSELGEPDVENEEQDDTYNPEETT